MPALRDEYRIIDQAEVPAELKIKPFLDLLSVLDPSSEDDRHTLYNMLLTAGAIFEAEELGLYTLERKIYSVEDYPDHKGPRTGPCAPIMTPEQAVKSIVFLKERLPSAKGVFIDGVADIFYDDLTPGYRANTFEFISAYMPEEQRARAIAELLTKLEVENYEDRQTLKKIFLAHANDEDAASNFRKTPEELATHFNGHPMDRQQAALAKNILSTRFPEPQ